MKIANGQTILFIGDSITDNGRRGANAPLGAGYVKLVADLLTIRHPKHAIAVINKGIGGDTVTGLRNRWSDDVIRNKPDWISIMVGINDLHRVLLQLPDPITPEVYREAYEDILVRTKADLPHCKILLIDPFFISTDRAPTSFRNTVQKLLPEYLQVVKDLSKRHDTLHVKTHAVFQQLLENHEPDTFCAEPVHPNPTGHLVIADAVYKALTQ